MMHYRLLLDLFISDGIRFRASGQCSVCLNFCPTGDITDDVIGIVTSSVIHTHPRAPIEQARPHSSRAAAGEAAAYASCRAGDRLGIECLVFKKLVLELKDKIKNGLF